MVKQVFLDPTQAGLKGYEKLVTNWDKDRPRDAHDVETACGWDVEARFDDARKALGLKADDKTGIQAQVVSRDGKLKYRYWIG